MSEAKTTMLIAYDGSNRAQRALQQAARLLKPSTVHIITAWEPVNRQTARALGRTGMPQTTVELDSGDAAREHALRVLESGIDLADSLGITAHTHLVETSASIAQAIVESAGELDVDVIVVGTRALTGVRSWFSSSTAEAIVHEAGIPVFIVPPTDDDDEGFSDFASENPLSAW